VHRWTAGSLPGLSWGLPRHSRYLPKNEGWRLNISKKRGLEAPGAPPGRFRIAVEALLGRSLGCSGALPGGLGALEILEIIFRNHYFGKISFKK